MSTIQVRDVPDDVADAIAEKAAAGGQSVSAYLRELMAADVAADLRRKAMRHWVADVGELQARLGLPNQSPVTSATLVREVRDSYERDHS